MTEHTGRPPSRPTSYSRVTLSRIMTAVDVNEVRGYRALADGMGGPHRIEGSGRGRPH